MPTSPPLWAVWIWEPATEGPKATTSPASHRTQPWPYRCHIGPPHGAASILAAPLLPAAQVVTQPPGQEVNPCRDGQEIVQQVAHTRAGPAGPGPQRHPSDWHCRWSPRRARQGAAGRDAAAQGRLLHLCAATSSRGTYLVSRGRWSFWCPPSALLSFSRPRNPRLPSSSPRSWPGGPASRDKERKEAPSDSVCWHIALVGAVLQLGHRPRSWERCSFG